VGRLENIIARNQRPNQLRERMVVSLGFGSIVLLILALMVFTDLGKSPDAPADPVPAAAAPRPINREKHIDGVNLWRVPAKKPAAKPAP
jgi:hypothetical protein